MRTSVRTGVALSVSSLALSGFTMLAPQAGASTASAPRTAATTIAATTTAGPQPMVTCRYQVTARRGLNVRETPNGKILGALPFHTIIRGTCVNRGWVQLKGGVKPAWIDKWVFRQFLRRL